MRKKNVKAGNIAVNHNETQAARGRLKSTPKAGLGRTNYNESPAS